MGHLDSSCFWLRGLPPLMWTYPHCMRESGSSTEFTTGRPSLPMALPPEAIIGTDGSGGCYSAEPRLRRCGWGFVVLNRDLETIGTGKGP